MSVPTHESIYRLIPPPAPRLVRPPRHKSRFSDTVREDAKLMKSSTKTMVRELYTYNITKSVGFILLYFHSLTSRAQLKSKQTNQTTSSKNTQMKLSSLKKPLLQHISTVSVKSGNLVFPHTRNSHSWLGKLPRTS